MTDHQSIKIIGLLYLENTLKFFCHICSFILFLIKVICHTISYLTKKGLNMKKILVSLAAVLALGTSAYAGVNSQTGCGLGAMIIKDDSSAILLALQATTNGTSANQTFGITSGTLGCKRAKLVMNERAEDFVASNMDTLAKEIAIGHGESLDTLAELLNVEDKATFSASLQANYNKIYTSQKVKMADVLDHISTTSM